MRLAFIFLLVLGTSILLCSLATWGITYSSSYSGVTSMAVDFTILAQGAVDNFGELVQNLIQDSSKVMHSIIAEELHATNARIDQTETQVVSTATYLMAQARNASEQSKEDIQALVVSFASFMGNVIDDFEAMAAHYASMMRVELATKAKTAFQGLMRERITVVQRAAYLYSIGIFHMTRNPQQPVQLSDCVILSMLCGASKELQYRAFVFLGTETSAHYSCHNDILARMYTSQPNGSLTNKGLLVWKAYPEDTPESQRRTWMDRCLNEPPQYEPLGVGCHPDEPCGPACGYDPRCRKWYLSQSTVKGPAEPRMSEPFTDFVLNTPMVTLTYPVNNATYAPTALLGVSSVEFYFSSMDAFLRQLPMMHGTRMAVILNDTGLTIVGDSSGAWLTRNCSNLGVVHSCDPTLQALGEWLDINRYWMHNESTVLLGDIIWDIFPSIVDAFTYFVVVGMNESSIYGPIMESQAEALRKLEALRVEHVAKLAVATEETRRQMMAAEQANLAELGDMRNRLFAESAALQARSQAALDYSNNFSTNMLEELIEKQNQSVRELEKRNLVALARNVGWSAAVVVATFLGTLVVGAFGTMSITRSLLRIIKAMEDVADMRVESLEVHRGSSVMEVHRIQIVFKALVERLAYYKSFMPAGLFQEPTTLSSLEEVAHVESVCYGFQSASASSALQELRFHPIVGVRSSVVPISNEVAARPGSVHSAANTLSTKVTKRNIVAMVVNILRFRETIFSSSEGQMETILNLYISIVHEVVFKGRGHVDCVVGDQILVTFNAHIPCSDPIVTAPQVALDLQAALSTRLLCGLNTQVGLTGGMVFAGSSGYGPFKAMVTVGPVMKLAGMLAHLHPLGDSAVLVDNSIEERARYNYKMRPVDLVYLPVLGEQAPRFARNVRVYQVQSAKRLEQDEWMYQIATNEVVDDWSTTFDQLASAETLENVRNLLKDYLATHASDQCAMRLQGRLGHWRPRAGIPLCEGPEPMNDDPCSSTPAPSSCSPE